MKTHTDFRTLALLSLILGMVSVSCKVRESSLSDDKGDRFWRVTAAHLSEFPESVFEKKAEFGKVPGIVIGITPAGWGSFNRAAVDSLKTKAKKVFFDRLLRNKDLFFTMVAVNTENLGLIKFIANRKLVNEAAAEMKKGYDYELSDLPAEFRARITPESKFLETKILIVNDADKQVFDLFRLPTDSAGVDSPVPVSVIGKDLKVYGPYWLPTDTDKVMNQLNSLL